jgi:3-phenylpropionate/cinnamic acid dioxygenase small subunit
MSLEDLIAERAIQRQLIKLARAMDNRDWDSAAAVMADDIQADFGTGPVQGRDQVIAFIRSCLDPCGTTQHLLGNILVDVTGETATSEAYVSDMHLSRQPDSDLSFFTLGNYSDKWQRAGDGWLLVERVKDNRETVGSMDVFAS